MRYIFLILLFTIISVISSQPFVLAQDKKAVELIKQSRKALGGQKLESLQNLTAKGKLAESFADDRTGEGKFEFTIALPDKFLKTETKATFGDNEITEIQAMNGTNEWFDVKAAGGNVMTFNRETKNSNEPSKKSSVIRQMMTRFFLGMFAAAPTGFPVEFSFAGTAQSTAEAGGGIADVLDVKGEGFNARLFIDQKTHLPLMITYKDFAPVMEMTIEAPAGKPTKQKKPDKNAPKLKNEMPLKMPAADFQMTFEDFRETGGVLLPYRITESANGKPLKEWSFTDYKLNSPIKPEIFNKK